MSTVDGKTMAQMASDFLKSRFGELYIAQLSLKYNDLHHSAESESLTAEQKAMRVERAAGVKYAIDFVVNREKLLEANYYPKDQPKA